MFDKRELIRLKPLILFFLIFTAGFYLFAVTLKYTFPFLAGFLLALLAQPIIRWLKGRLRMPPAIASAVATLVVYVILFGILFLLGYWLIVELSRLVSYVTSLSKQGTGSLTGPVNYWIEQIGKTLTNVDSNFIKQNQEKILDIAKSSIGIVSNILTTILQFLTSLPAIFTMLLVMIFSTYFFSKDMSSIKEHIYSFFPHTAKSSLHHYTRKGTKMGGRYVFSYLFIYFITFVETLIVFIVLKIPYPLVLSIITGIADILPVLGPGTIYIPLSVILLIRGHYLRAGILLLCWFLITAIRQIIEPKIVSSSINIHPLTMLAAIYLALIAKNFWILIYFPVLVILYQLLTQEGALPTLFPRPDSDDSGEKGS